MPKGSGGGKSGGSSGGSKGSSGGSSKGSTGSSHTSGPTKSSNPMTKPDASRIQSYQDKNPSSDTAKTNFGPRAQSTADKKA